LARSDLAEGEGVGLNTGIEERNLECVLSNRANLSDELVEPLFGNRAVAFAVNVNSVSSARWQAIDENPKSHRTLSRCRAHNEMKIAGVKPVCDLAVGLV
jgi:hypothetical protein